MKELFQRAIEWLQSRVTVLRNTRGVCENEDISKAKEETLNPKLSTLNQAKLRLTIPDIERLLREKYELRYNVLTEQSEYRAKGSDGAFRAVTQRVYKTWMADLQADGYAIW